MGNHNGSAISWIFEACNANGVVSGSPNEPENVTSSTQIMPYHNLLLDLPYPIDQSIINDWLDLQDVSSLDIAFTNHFHRDSFLHLLSFRSARSLQIEQVNLPRLYPIFLQWLMKRKIFLKLLALDRRNWRYMMNDLKYYLPLLNKVEILGIGCTHQESDRQFPVRTLQHCPHVHALILINIQEFSYLKYRYCRKGRQYLLLDKYQTAPLLPHPSFTTTSSTSTASSLINTSPVKKLMKRLQIIDTEKTFFRFQDLKAISLLNTSIPQHIFNLLLYHSKSLQGMMINNSVILMDIPFRWDQWIDNECEISQRIFGRLKFLQVIKCHDLSTIALIFMLQASRQLEYLKIQKDEESILVQNWTTTAGGGGGNPPVNAQGMMGENDEEDPPVIPPHQIHPNQPPLSTESLMTTFVNSLFLFAQDILEHIDEPHYSPAMMSSSPTATTAATTGMLANPILSSQQIPLLNAFHANILPTHPAASNNNEDVTGSNTNTSPSNHNRSSPSSIPSSSPLHHPYFPTLSLLHCPLKTLDVEGIHELRDPELILLVHGVAATLREINLNFCYRITDKSIIYLGQKCQRLKILLLSYCYQLTDTGMKQFSYYYQQHLERDEYEAYDRQLQRQQQQQQQQRQRQSTVTSIPHSNLNYPHEETASSPSSGSEFPTVSTTSTTTAPHQGLEILHLYGCYQLTDETLQALIPITRHSLQHLSISECRRITDAGIIPFFQASEKLEKLCINRTEACHTITNHSLQAFCQEGIVQLKCQQLKTLLFSNLIHFEEITFLQFFRYCSQLVVLDLSCHHTQVTDAVITVIARSCHSLRTLDIHECTALTDQALISISEGLQELLDINLQYVLGITAEGIITLLQSCHNIQKIDASFCHLGGESIIERIKSEGKVVWNEEYIFYRRVKPSS